MVSKQIEVTNEDKYVLLTLNQPETLNAFSKDMITSLCDEILSLSAKRVNKALIITGKGKAFSSGGNLAVMKEYVDQNKGKEYIESIVPYVNKLISLLLEWTGPTLAILHGSAVGGGFNVAMACDFRIVHEKAKFRLGFIDIGLTPATGNSFFLPKILGIPRTMALSLFSEVITAKNMIDWHLAHELYTDNNAAEVKNKWIKKISLLDALQVKSVRKLLYAGMTNSYDQQLNLEYETLIEAGGSSLFKDRVTKRWQELQKKDIKT